jgi:hypothetical protein
MLGLAAACVLKDAHLSTTATMGFKHSPRHKLIWTIAHLGIIGVGL